jgi:type II secretory pathway pseudopilin PulG
VIPTRSGEAGYSLVALMAGLTIMLILMGMATPAWRYLMQDMREEELIFRGSQIAEAIERYQKKNGNTYPPTMEILVKGKYLRKEYKDPMVPSGKWRILKPGEMPIPGLVPGQPQRPGSNPPASVPNLPGRDPTSGPAASGVGPVAGVVSTSKLKGYRKFNNRESYNEWAFIAGQPRVVGDTPMPGMQQRPPGGPPGGPPPGVPVPPGGLPSPGMPGMPTPPPQGPDPRRQ